MYRQPHEAQLNLSLYQGILVGSQTVARTNGKCRVKNNDGPAAEESSGTKCLTKK
jgi:hypothetical protein